MSIKIRNATRLGKFICWLRGVLQAKRQHKKGTRIAVADGIVTYACGRCGATWTRKEGVRA